MVNQQVHVVVVLGMDPQTKSIKVHVPQVFSSKADAVAFVKVNKVPGEQKKWEIHTTVADLIAPFSFARDVPPNYK